MTLAYELALTCCARQKRAADLTGLRDEFEGSALREQSLRENAQRLEELAASRAAREDTSPAGYASTAGKRLMPVPHTAGEAAVRLPAMAAGGYLGHQLGKQFEPMNSTMLEQALSPTNEKGLEGLGRQIESLRPKVPSAPIKMNPNMTQYPGMAAAAPAVDETVPNLLKELQTTPGHEISDALRHRAPLGISRPGSSLKSRLTGLVGEANMPRLRSSFSRHLDPEKSLASRLSRYRVGGAVGGALAGGAIAGLPFIIRALMQKRHGGEAAVRARGQAGEASQKAEGESQHREDILNKLPAEASA